MGETRAMQPLITVKGEKNASSPPNTGNVIQPAQFWGDAKDVKDAVFHVQILAQNGEAGTPNRLPKLVLETAASPAGPWKAIREWPGTAGVPINDVVGASTRAPGFDPSPSMYLLERFYRWKIDASALNVANDTWAMCFGICVTLK